MEPQPKVGAAKDQATGGGMCRTTSTGAKCVGQTRSWGWAGASSRRAMSGEAVVSMAALVVVVSGLDEDDEQPEHRDVEHASNRRGQAGYC